MNYNFDEIINRNGTDSVKWDGVEGRWGRNDLIPMWVADMDFRTAPFVIEALKKRLEHEVLGYTFACKEWAASIIHWLKERHGWSVTEEMLTFTPGIVRGLAFAIHCFTEKGDKVMVMPPVYHPFFLVAQKNEREVVFSPLVLRDGQYYIDFDRFRRDVQGCKILILSNPHNPGGIVWKKDMLVRLAEICAKHHILVISDEIHAEMAYPQYTHHPFATVSEAAANCSITFMAPSKTFNIAGIVTSYSIIPNAGIREQFYSFMEAGEFGDGTIFAYTATEAAYTYGAEWLQQMRMYITENVRFVDDYLKANLPKIKAYPPQASFLIWLDCRDLKLSQPELVSLFEEKAGLLLNNGSMFGPGGEGFMRLNIGCPRSVLKTALEALKKAVNKK